MEPNSKFIDNYFYLNSQEAEQKLCSQKPKTWMLRLASSGKFCLSILKSKEDKIINFFHFRLRCSDMESALEESKEICKKYRLFLTNYYGPREETIGSIFHEINTISKKTTLKSHVYNDKINYIIHKIQKFINSLFYSCLDDPSKCEVYYGLLDKLILKIQSLKDNGINPSNVEKLISISLAFKKLENKIIQKKLLKPENFLSIEGYSILSDVSQSIQILMLSSFEDSYQIVKSFYCQNENSAFYQICSKAISNFRISFSEMTCLDFLEKSKICRFLTHIELKKDIDFQESEKFLKKCPNLLSAHLNSTKLIRHLKYPNKIKELNVQISNKNYKLDFLSNLENIQILELKIPSDKIFNKVNFSNIKSNELKILQLTGEFDHNLISNFFIKELTKNNPSLSRFDTSNICFLLK